MPEEKFLTRREFITAMTAVGGSVAVAAVLSDIKPLTDLIQDELALQLPAVQGETETVEARTGKHSWGMVIDLSKCIGCQYCVYACQAVNDVPDDMRWNIYFPDITENGVPFNMTRPCLHCQNAPCVSVCPVAATFHRDDGLVVMDYQRCIGCRYCEVACPYGVRAFNWRKRTKHSGYQPEWGEAEVVWRPRGVVEKCTFCIHRIDRGLSQGLTPGIDRAATPACVNICPVRARVFGDLKDPESPISKIIRTTPTFRLREDLGTEPNVYYVPVEGMGV
ncbi:MAG TPA: 4Fe-4S dicluster domain-containing protein [Aggregatilineaceae bacterium]|nr:4Fe-4S dicluster domain-containing protein [Aggregatilineaceae bacterium]